jgi:hypothetical protein
MVDGNLQMWKGRGKFANLESKELEVATLAFRLDLLPTYPGRDAWKCEEFAGTLRYLSGNI